MEIADLKVRMPTEVKDWLASRANENDRSMNSEVIAILKSMMRGQSRRTRKVEGTADEAQ